MQSWTSKQEICIIQDINFADLTMSWGAELWDEHKRVVGHVTEGVNNLVDVYAKYVKEKAELEKEYAKGLRKLIAMYQPKKFKKNTETDESSEILCFW
jgi:hypothetical protein